MEKTALKTHLWAQHATHIQIHIHTSMYILTKWVNKMYANIHIKLPQSQPSAQMKKK